MITSFHSLSQNVTFITVPHHNDSIGYNFLDYIIKKNTSVEDSVVIFLESGVLKHGDTIYTEMGLCMSTINSINKLDRYNRKVLTSGLGSFIDLVIKKKTNKLHYVDSICDVLTGQSLMWCYANQCYLDNSKLRDTIIKYSGLEDVDKYLLEARLSIVNRSELLLQNIDILNQIATNNTKVFYLSMSFIEDSIDCKKIVLLPKFLMSDDGKVKRNKFDFFIEEKGKQFNDITDKELPNKVFLNTWYKRPSHELNDSQLYYTILSHPCFAFQEPLPLPNRIKRKVTK